MRRSELSHLFSRALALAIVLMLTLMVASAWAQTITGSIVGTVRDADGGVLPGATLTVTNADTGLTRVVTTNEGGAYRVEALPVGRYDVEVRLDSFQTSILQGLTVNIAAVVRSDVTLQLGPIEQELVVTAEAPLIETELGSISSVVSEQEIKDLPLNGREFVQLGLLQPGTGRPPGQHYYEGIAVNGQRYRSTNFLVDGIDNNLQWSGGLRNATVPVDAVQEFRLVQNNFPAEFGRNTGGILNVTTKTGSNEWHGSGWWFNRNSATEARNFFNPGEPSDRNRDQFGFTLGGPIVQDRSFFFAAYEGTRNNSGDVYTFLSPTRELRERAVGVARDLVERFPHALPSKDFLDLDGDGVMDFGEATDENNAVFERDNLLVKVDHTWSGGNDHLAARYLLDDMYDGDEGRGPPEFGTDNPTRAQSAGVSHTHVFGSGAVNELRAGWSRNHDVHLRQNPEIPDIWLGDTWLWWGGDEPGDLQEDTFQVYDSFGFDVGDHHLELGGELRHWRSDSVLDLGVDGYYEFFSSLDFFDGRSADYFLLTRNPVTGGPPDTARVFSGSEWGFFIKDDWRVNDRLTINLGLRYELFAVPGEEKDRIANGVYGIGDGFTERVAGSDACGLMPDGSVYCYGGGSDTSGLDPEEVQLIADGKLFEGDHNNFAPRFGLAYDLTGDGRTSLRLGAGVGYDRLFNNVFENARWNPPHNGFIDWLGPVFGGNPIPVTIPASVPGDFSAGVAQTRWMDPRLRTSYATNAFVGLQREVWRNTSVEVNYAGSFGRKLPRIEDINRYSGDLLDGSRDRLTPNMSNANFRTNSVNSNYHSLQLQLQQRYTRGLGYQLNYTWALLEDSGDSDVFGFTGDWVHSVSIEDQAAEKGTSNQELRHRFVGSFSYQLPWLKEAGGWKEQLLGGWQLNGIVDAHSGWPFTVVTVSSFFGGGDYNADGKTNDRPDLVGSGEPIDDQTGSPANGYLDPDDFAAPEGAGTEVCVGNTDRNQFRSPGYWNVDLSLFKNFRLSMGGRDATLQFRAEVFNAFNHPNFWIPIRGLNAPDFGRSTFAENARIWQFALKFIY